MISRSEGSERYVAWLHDYWRSERFVDLYELYDDFNIRDCIEVTDDGVVVNWRLHACPSPEPRSWFETELPPEESVIGPKESFAYPWEIFERERVERKSKTARRKSKRTRMLCLPFAGAV